MMHTDNAQGGFFAALWKFLASVKLTISLLLLLAGASMIGTLIPQNADHQTYIRTYGEFLYHVLTVFDLFNMYYSWWFRALILLLTVNITVCTLRRWPATWTAAVSGPPRFESVVNKKPLQEFLDLRKIQDLKPVCMNYLKKRYKGFRVELQNDEYIMTAEKGRWSRLGVPIVHLSVVIVLAGALVGSIFGFDGYVNIPEGGSIDRIQLRNRDASLPLGFTVQCDDFNVSFYDSGEPKEYRSRLGIAENGRRVLEKDIIVNDPLRYKGINFFQSSYGAMPPDNLELSFTPNGSGEAFRRNVAIGQSVELPAGGGSFTVREYNRDYHYKEAEVGEAVTGVLDKPGQAPEEVVLPLRFPSFDKMRKGQWIIAVERYENKNYTGLQVTSDPGVPLVYTGFILLILGCWTAFFVSHQKIVVKVTSSSDGSRVRVFGSASRNHVGFENAIRKMAETLGGR